MRRIFLLTYNDDLGTRDQIKEALDKNSLVLTWRYDLPHCFYLVSEVNAKKLAESIRTLLPTGRFIVTAADDDYWGWNNDHTWYLFSNKTNKPNKPATGT